jgi:hypothetical protein
VTVFEPVNIFLNYQANPLGDKFPDMIIDRPEHNLLLSCARVCSDKEREDSIVRFVHEGIDWDYLLEAAATHYMTSMLYWYLNAACREDVPPSILEKLHKHYQISAKSNLLYTAELFRILKLFEENNIPAIPFKGPVLSLTLYEDPALREFCDLDILVQKKDVFRALRLLSTIGYKKIVEYPRVIEAKILEQQNHFQVEKNNQSCLVEIHWMLTPGYLDLSYAIEDCWKRVKDISIQSHRFRTLQSEDLLMSLCIHGFKHMWHSIFWLADIARFLDKHPNLNWDFIFKRYTHPEIQRILFIGLIISRDCLEVDLPINILDICKKDLVAVRLAQKSCSLLFHEPEEIGKFQLISFQIRLKSFWYDRLHSVFHYLTKPAMADWNIDWPETSLPLYYLRRPFRVFRQYLSNLKSRI